MTLLVKLKKFFQSLEENKSSEVMLNNEELLTDNDGIRKSDNEFELVHAEENLALLDESYAHVRSSDDIQKRLLNLSESLHNELECLKNHFDESYYLSMNADVEKAGVDPLRHYCTMGWRERRNPSPIFSTAFYLESNPDVAQAQINPFWHYIAIGKAEGRESKKLVGNDDIQKRLHNFLETLKNEMEQLKDHFDESYYLLINIDIEKAGVDPLEHYCTLGWKEYRNPSPIFSTAFYLESNPDVAQAQINPFWHYIAIGKAEGREGKNPNEHQVEKLKNPPVEGLIVKQPIQLSKKINYNIEGVKYFCGLIVVHGWIADPMNQMKSILLRLDNESMEYKITPSILRFQRSDLISAFANEGATHRSHFGFVATQEISSQKIEQKVSIELQTEEGEIFNEEFSISNVNSDLTGLSFIRGIIPDSDITAERCNKFYKPLFNALIKSQPSAKIALDKLVPEIIGNPREILKPTLSVIIPLYGGVRFEVTQIPQLAALKRSDWEIIFVIDDPSISTVVTENIERLANNYGLPIRILASDRNLGFSGINNLAASQARADTLLFLNSDCFITTSRPIIDAFEWLNNSNHGAAGFRLFYSDNSVQHDGMSTSLWNNNLDFYLNQHPRSGVASKDLPYTIEHDSARLLTAACFMLKKHLFEQVGGFDVSYFRGDFEDSDLCLKIIAKGKKLGIVRQAGIYHLERQSIGSQSDDLRQIITLVNSNIYTQRWKKIFGNKLPSLEVIS